MLPGFKVQQLLVLAKPLLPAVAWQWRYIAFLQSQAVPWKAEEQARQEPQHSPSSTAVVLSPWTPMQSNTYAPNPVLTQGKLEARCFTFKHTDLSWFHWNSSVSHNSGRAAGNSIPKWPLPHQSICKNSEVLPYCCFSPFLVFNPPDILEKKMSLTSFFSVVTVLQG